MVVQRITVTALYLHQAESVVVVDQHKHMAAQDIPAHITEMELAAELLLTQELEAINIIMAVMAETTPVVVVGGPMATQVLAEVV